MKTQNGIKNSSKAHYNILAGPVKIKDGLFLGDEAAARVLYIFIL